MANEKLMKHFPLKKIAGFIIALTLLAGSWAYAQNSQTPPAPQAQTEPPQLPTQPASVSPETLRLLEMIERKNRELKKREEELLLKEKNLEALEKKILSDLQKIEGLRIRIAGDTDPYSLAAFNFCKEFILVVVLDTGTSNQLLLKEVLLAVK